MKLNRSLEVFTLRLSLSLGHILEVVLPAEQVLIISNLRLGSCKIHLTDKFPDLFGVCFHWALFRQLYLVKPCPYMISRISRIAFESFADREVQSSRVLHLVEFAKEVSRYG